MCKTDTPRPVSGADPIGAPTPEATREQVSDSSPSAARDAALIEAARTVAEDVLLPRAAASDMAAGPDPENFRALAAAGLLGLGVPVRFSGQEASPEAQRSCTELLAAACGVTTFVQAQHHGPCRMIAACPNEALKARLLPDLAAGRALCGISFAHLRRPGPPVLRATRVPGGYRLDGTAPWVTGWGLMNQFVFGAVLPDQQFIYLWSPVRRADYADLFAETIPKDGDLVPSGPIPLCAMNASATVLLTCDGWFVPDDHTLAFSDHETMQRNDRLGVLGGTALPLGCAAASVRLLCETADRRSSAAITRAAETFQREWERMRDAIRAWDGRSNEPGFFEQAVRLRARAIEFAVRAAHAAVAASSGSANTQTHPAQRLLREAMFYTVQAQTQEVMAATLEQLERQ